MWSTWASLRYLAQPRARWWGPALAGAAPTYIYRPAHYLKQFHQKYTDETTLKALVESHGRFPTEFFHFTAVQPVVQVVAGTA